LEVTLATPNDRHINDERIAQAVAQLLTQVNCGGWSDPAFDAAFVKPLSTMGDARREQLLRQSVARAIEQQLPLLPLHVESPTWAYRQGPSDGGRADQDMLAMGTKPAG